MELTHRIFQRRQDLMQRFWNKVEILPNGCWRWTACRTKNKYGHGQFNFDGKLVYAHRFAYEALIGPIPDGLTLDHLCRNPACVNPAHLEPVPLQENLRRGIRNNGQRAKTHCLRGHPFDLSNTYYYKGGRHCRICSRDNMRKYRKVKKEE